MWILTGILTLAERLPFPPLAHLHAMLLPSGPAVQQFSLLTGFAGLLHKVKKKTAHIKTHIKSAKYSTHFKSMEAVIHRDA